MTALSGKAMAVLLGFLAIMAALFFPYLGFGYRMLVGLVGIFMILLGGRG